SYLTALKLAYIHVIAARLKTSRSARTCLFPRSNFSASLRSKRPSLISPSARKQRLRKAYTDQLIPCAEIQQSVHVRAAVKSPSAISEMALLFEISNKPACIDSAAS